MTPPSATSSPATAPDGIYINGEPYYHNDNLGLVDEMIAGTLPTTQATGSIQQADLIDATDPPNGFTPPSWTYNNPIPGGGGIWYGFTATGTFNVTTAGTYSFALGSDDGSRLTVDGNLVGEFNAGRAFGVTYATYYLTAGPHTFVWTGFQGSGQAGFELSVSDPAHGTNTSTVSAANGWYVLGDTNANDGVQLQGSMAVTVYYISAANTIAGNYIGTNAAGTGALDNAYSGVYVLNSTGNVIGTNSNGSAGEAAEGNVISGNGQYGVRLQTSFQTVVAGNMIGTNATGTAAVGNGLDGVFIHGDSAANLIGTNADGVNDVGERNVISGNDRWGIFISDVGTSDNTVAGNYIGTNAAGTGALGNGSMGVYIANSASNNLIGTNGNNAATDADARNVISGNGWDGVQLYGVGTNNNVVAGNYIGVDATGNVAMRDGAAGVSIFGGASNNRVGTSGNEADNAGERNIISGNTYTGVFICDSNTTGNLVAGNYIGTNAAGTAAIPNPTAVYDQGANNTIGGATAAMANVIAGSTNYDIQLASGALGDGSAGSFDATGNVVQGNLIGTDYTGTLALSGSNTRVFVSGGGSNSLLNNTYGGSGGYALQQGSGGTITVSGTIAGDVSDSGTLDLHGSSVSIGALSGSGVVTSSVAGAVTLIVGNTNDSATFSGVIQNGSGTVALTMAGTGAQTLSGASTYTGTTTVNAGTLTFSNQLVPSTQVAIASGATLAYAVTSGSFYIQQNNVTFTGAGTLLKSGAGQIFFGGPNGGATLQFSSGALIDIEGGLLVGGRFGQDVWTNNLSDLKIAAGAMFAGAEANVRVNALTGSGTLTTGFSGAGYSTFTIGVNNGSGSFSGLIGDGATLPNNAENGGGPGSITKVGSGTETLSGVNTYTGATSINAGTLVAASATALGNNSAVTVASGATLSVQSAAGQPGLLGQYYNLYPTSPNSSNFTSVSAISTGQSASDALPDSGLRRDLAE